MAGRAGEAVKRKGRLPMRKIFSSCVPLVWMLVMPALAAGQTTLTVFAGGAVTAPVKEAGAAFTRTSGHMFVYVSDTTGALQKRLASGEQADVVVVAGPGMDALIKEKLVVPESRT